MEQGTPYELIDKPDPDKGQFRDLVWSSRDCQNLERMAQKAEEERRRKNLQI